MSHQQKSPIESLSEAEWTALPANVQAVVIGLVEENRQLRLTISKLEEQRRRNSRNSSQAPSQDKAAQKPIQEATTRPRRRRGGQTGHCGRGRALVLVEAVDQLVVHRPVQCQTCGALLLGYDSTPRRHQVTEVPQVKATVTEHQVHTLTCPCCGAINRGTLPPEVATSQFGPNLVSLMTVLVQPSVAGLLPPEQAPGGRSAGHLLRSSSGGEECGQSTAGRQCGPGAASRGTARLCAAAASL